MTVLELMKELGPRINDQDGRPFPLLDAVNNVIRALSRELIDRKSDLAQADLEIEFEAGTGTATLPADFQGLRGKPWPEGKRTLIAPLPMSYGRQVYEGKTGPHPEHYVIADTAMALFPVPSIALTIKGRYYVAPPVIAAMTTTIPYPQFYDAVRAGVMLLNQHGLLYCVTSDFRSFIEEAVVRSLRRRDDHARTTTAYYL